MSNDNDSSTPRPVERIGYLAMQLAEVIESTYGEEATVHGVVIVADVIAGPDDNPINPIVVCGSDPRVWLQLALLREGLDIAEARNEARIEEAEQAEEGDSGSSPV